MRESPKLPGASFVLLARKRSRGEAHLPSNIRLSSAARTAIPLVPRDTPAAVRSQKRTVSISSV